MTGAPALSRTPITSSGGHARPFAETDRWLSGVLDRVPVTRVYDATSLDSLGLPVWAAVTPLARDLTVHAGKGTTHVAARVSAVMEAIERVCAEDVDPRRVRRASYAALETAEPGAAIDPAGFDLPFQTSYDARRALSWIEGDDLRTDRSTWVPLDVVISPAREGICLGVETNGLAAGNTMTEAVVHALYELIERDAAARERFVRRYADPSTALLRVVDIDSLPAAPAELVAGLADRGVRVTIENLTHDLEVPVFKATIGDRAFPGREGTLWRFEGLGCDLDAERAVTRAITEAAQSHTVLLVGARDAFEDIGRHARRNPGGLVRQLLTRSTTEPFEEHRGPDELSDCLAILLERLDRAGLDHAIVVDLTDPALGVPVVRVLVPGLAGPYGETARRPGIRLLRTLL